MDDSSSPLGQADVVTVLNCLQGALDQNPDVQRQAEATLISFENRPGFCSCLLVSASQWVVCSFN
jgi:hypothetical protein